MFPDFVRATERLEYVAPSIPVTIVEGAQAFIQPESVAESKLVPEYAGYSENLSCVVAPSIHWNLIESDML